MTVIKISFQEGEDKIWRGPDIDNIDELMDKWQSLGHYFFHCLGEKFPDKILFTDYKSGRRWTGAQLKDKILSVACALIDKYDFKPGTVACISYDNSDYVLILAIAIICAGGVVACSYPKDPYAELLYLARKVEPKFLFCHNKNVAWVKQLEQDLGYKIRGISMNGTPEGKQQSSHLQVGFFSDMIRYDHTKSLARAEIPVTCRDIRKEVALIIMSSGTSGKPKAVAQTHWNILADFFGGRLNDQTGDSFACSASLDYVSGRMILFGAIHAGYQAIILNGFEPSTFLDAVQKYKVQEILTGVASFYELITYSRIEEYDITSLRCITPVGAEIIYLDELRSFLERHQHVSVVRQGYGASEFGVSSLNIMSLQDISVNIACSGKLMPGFQAKIVDPTSGRLLGPNQQGIVHIRGESVFPGYYDKSLMHAGQAANRDKSAATNGIVSADMNLDGHTSNNDDNLTPFVRGKDIFDDDGYYITGDYAYFSDKEELFIIGRQKEVMVCRGAKKVAPHELESIIGQHPAVDKVCVLGVDNQHEPALHCPRAFVVPKTDYYDQDVDDLEFNDELNKDSNEEKLTYSGASEPKLCRVKSERRHLIVEDLMRFVNERVGWEKQLTGGIVLLDNIPTSRGTGKMDKNYLRTLSLDDIEIYGDRSS